MNADNLLLIASIFGSVLVNSVIITWKLGSRIGNIDKELSVKIARIEAVLTRHLNRNN